MKTTDNISNKAFSLHYQVCSNGRNGYVLLPPGMYSLVKINQSGFSGNKWAEVKQPSWDITKEISIDDFLNFQNYE